MSENTFNSALQNELTMSEMVRTENGAVMHASTGKAFLDAFWKISSCRGIKDESEIIKIFAPCFREDFELACRMLFYIRDCRAGCGEKRTFNILFKWLLNKYTDSAEQLFWIIPTYGSWKDIVSLAYETDNLKLYIMILDQLTADLKNFADNKPISLLAKWLPSINTSSAKTVKMAKVFCEKLKFTHSKYRKMLASLRKYLNVVECKMCANEWSDIDYNTVPSKANLRYKNAFMKHDSDRRHDYLGKLAANDESVKINTAVLEPYEIVRSYFCNGSAYPFCGDYNPVSNIDESLELLWKNLPRTDVLRGKNMICVHDNSGSMTSYIDMGAHLKARDVADSLAIYCSELLTGPWANKFITFSESPKIIDMTDDETLKDKIRSLYKKVECANTNIEGVFDLIFDIAVKNHVKQEEIPNVLVLSDMEFDGCTIDSSGRYCGGWDGWNAPRNSRMKTLFENIAEKYKACGYEMPKLIFWNIGSRTMGIPVRENENGVLLVSGFSKNIFNMVASAELDPFKCLKNELMKERYDAVSNSLLVEELVDEETL